MVAKILDLVLIHWLLVACAGLRIISNVNRDTSKYLLIESQHLIITMASLINTA